MNNSNFSVLTDSDEEEEKVSDSMEDTVSGPQPPLVLILGLYTTGIQIAKHLVEVGVPRICIYDNRKLRAKRLHYHPCFTKKYMGKPIHVCVKEYLETLAGSTTINIVNNIFSARFTHVVQTDNWPLRFPELPKKLYEPINLNIYCRRHNIIYYLALHFGYFGYLFSDLGVSRGSTLSPCTDRALGFIMKHTTFENENRSILNIEEPISEETYVALQEYVQNGKNPRQDLLYEYIFPPIGFMMGAIITQEILKWQYLQTAPRTTEWEVHEKTIQYIPQQCSINFTSLFLLAEMYRSDPSRLVPKQLSAYMKKVRIGIFGSGNIAFELLQHIQQLDLCTHKISSVIIVDTITNHTALKNIHNHFQALEDSSKLNLEIKEFADFDTEDNMMHALDRDWWESKDFIISCGSELDDHREIARQCFFYDLDLFDVGGDTSMGHFQAIIPEQTTRYNTLKNTNIRTWLPPVLLELNSLVHSPATQSFSAAMTFLRILKHFYNRVYKDLLPIPRHDTFYSFITTEFIHASPVAPTYNEWKKITFKRLRCAQTLSSLLRKVKQDFDMYDILTLYYNNNLVYDKRNMIGVNLKLCQLYEKFSIPCMNYLVFHGTYINNQQQICPLPLIKYTMFYKNLT